MEGNETMIARIRILTLAAAALAIAALAPLPRAVADDAKPGLFVNLTTDDTWSATKAIHFAGKALAEGHKPVAIWLNVRAVYLADKKRPPHTHGLVGKSIHDMLKDFMAKGGQVVMCQACSAAAGLKQEDYIEGVVMGNWPLVSSILFDPKVKTLAW